MQEKTEPETTQADMASENTGSVEPQKTRMKRWVKPLVLTLLGVLVVAGLFCSGYKFAQIRQSRIVSTPTPIPLLTPTSTTGLFPSKNISTAVSKYYNDSLQLLENELESWDRDFLMTDINTAFGGTFKQLKEMYATGVVKPTSSTHVYSSIHRSMRLYQVNDKRIRQQGDEQDWSMYDNRERSWPSDKRLPSPDIGTAIEKCVDYAIQQGSYYLRKCFNGIDKYGGKRFGWTCEFVQEEIASKTTHLFEMDFKEEGSYLCQFDSETQEVKDWYESLPPP
jgi:hypothetical protein